MRAFLRRLGARAGISAGLVLIIAAIVIVARLGDAAKPSDGIFTQPDPGLPTVGPSAGDDGHIEATAAPTPDNVDVRTAARTFVEAWLRRDLDATAWHAGLAALATPTLGDSLKGVDPRGVPATRITGDLTVTLRSDLYALIAVPVDTGAVELGLTRQTDRWLVDSLDWQRT